MDSLVEEVVDSFLDLQDEVEEDQTIFRGRRQGGGKEGRG